MSSTPRGVIEFTAETQRRRSVMNERAPGSPDLNTITERIIGGCIEVHRHLGPGLLESAYEECVSHELTSAGLLYERQLPLPVVYKGIHLDCAYRLDLVVQGLVVVELKCVDTLLPIHEAQLLTYLKLTGHQVGILINFNVPTLRQGIKRLVYRFKEASAPPR